MAREFSFERHAPNQEAGISFFAQLLGAHPHARWRDIPSSTSKEEWAKRTPYGWPVVLEGGPEYNLLRTPFSSVSQNPSSGRSMGKMNVRRISKGLITVLQEDEGRYLYEIMDRHEELGTLIPGVVCPCDSVPGDDDDHLFILAFLEVLKHHVKLGQIDGRSDDDREAEIWQLWLSGKQRARRLQRPDNWISSSCEKILPKKYGVITHRSLALSKKTWTLLKAGEADKIIHLDHVESRIFKG